MKQPISSDKISFLELKKAVEKGTALYQSGEVGTVQLLYTKFVNTMTFQPDFDVLAAMYDHGRTAELKKNRNGDRCGKRIAERDLV
jgi:F0F1-type ATP synthase gamma subunit